MEHLKDNFLLIFIATITGILGLKGSDIDLYLGIFLKLISILSFFLLIIINLPKFIQTIKDIFRK